MYLALLLIRSRFSFGINGQGRTFEQYLDHFNSHNDTKFKQTYIVNDTYTDSGKFSQIIVYTGVEGVLDGSNAAETEVVRLASEMQARIIAIEHRFFGNSFPANPMNKDALQFLTVAQALEDLNVFLSLSSDAQCTDSTNCTVTMIGGGYLGSLASWMRLKYPSRVDVVLAASAPLRSIREFYGFDIAVGKALEKIKTGCSSAIKRVFNGIEMNAGHSNERLGFREWQSDASMMYAVADVVAKGVQYGKVSMLKSMCDVIDDGKDWTSFVGPFKTMTKDVNETVEKLDPMAYNVSSTFALLRDGRSSWWMTCNELGWFETASNGTMRSHWVNMSYFDSVCRTLFGIPPVENVDAFNTLYGSDDPKSTNVVFLKDENDPWLDTLIRKDDASFDLHVLTVENGTRCSELLDNMESSNITHVKKRMRTVMRKWMQRSAPSDMCGKNGEQILTKCFCSNRAWGEDCAEEFATRSAFRIVTIASSIITTSLLGIIGTYVWLCGRSEEFGARPISYTT